MKACEIKNWTHSLLKSPLVFVLAMSILVMVELMAESGPEALSASIGSVTNVNVTGQTHASYELFLPSSYSARKGKAPLVFAFSPVGSGSAMVNKLKPSCEKVGWVVIGCNRLRNGNDPMDRLMEWEILRDVRQRIPHDRQREYLAGFSGGAMRAYGMTRSYWDEFTGIIAFAGWLGVYDPAFVYPSRLAVAMLDGADEPVGLAAGERDRKILSQFQIRTKSFVFSGRHEIAPSPTIDEAIQWLEDDWNTKQKIRMSDTALKSDALLKQAQTVFGEGRYDAALETLTHLILEYAFSPAAGAADELIAQILNDGSRRTNALRSPLKAGNSAAGQILLARAEDREGFPAAQRTANCELAVALNPHSAMAAAQLAEALAMSDDAKLRDLERAEQLAVFAATSDPDSWYVWNVRASVANQKNQREAAIQHQQKALELAPRNFKKLCAYKLSRLRL